MVARNQLGDGSPNGEDGLPRRIRDRLRPVAPAAAVGHAPTLPHARAGWLRDASRFAGVFLLVAVVNFLVLLLALWVLNYGATTPPVPVLDPLPAR
jgi:hypothetical protein